MAIDDKHFIPAADIPAQLRALAGRVEAGNYGDVVSMFVVVPQDDAYPRTIGWGKIDGAFEPIIQFELARQWHLKAACGMLEEKHCVGIMGVDNALDS